MARKSEKNEKTEIALEETPPRPEEMKLPLFFKRPAALTPERHGKAGLKLPADFRFARPSNTIPVNAEEFAEAAKSYPIIFVADEAALPLAVVGMEQENYFLSGKGEWRRDHYIPAYVRRYPFVLMGGEQPEQFILGIDEAAPAFRDAPGKGVEPFFDQGKPSQLTQRALQFSGAFQNQIVATRQFCDALRRAGILAPYRSETALPDGRKIGLSGFMMVDAKKLEEMPEGLFLEFRTKGYLPLIYQALASAGNWRRIAALATERAEKTS